MLVSGQPYIAGLSEPTLSVGLKRSRAAYRAVELPFVKGADMTALRTADTLIKPKSALRA